VTRLSVYGWLARRLLPAPFYTQFGEEMARAHEDALRATPGVTVQWRRAAAYADLVVTAGAEWWRLWTAPRRPPRVHEFPRTKATIMGDLWQDIRFAIRTWRKSPRFAIPAVIILSLGIGATTTLYTVVRHVLWNPLPVPSPDRLYLLQEVSDQGSPMLVSYPNFDDWRSRVHSFDGLAARKDPGTIAAQVGTSAFRASVLPVSREFFSVLGIRPMIGRTIRPDENRPGGPQVAVVSERLWRERLGARPDLTDAQLRLVTVSDAPYQVVGVIPDRYWAVAPGDILLPTEDSPVQIRGAGNYRVIGRLRAGTSLEAARTEMNSIASALKAEYGEAEMAKSVAVTPLRDEVIGTARDPLMVLLIGAGVLLIAACLNVGLMLLARATTRAQEVAVRTALGASRERVIRQIVTENAMLALASAAVGAFLAWITVRAIRAEGPAQIPRLNELAMDARAWWFALLAALCAVLLFGVVPAFRLARETFAPLRSMRGSSGPGKSGPWHLLVGLQAALAVIMLVSAGLLVRSLTSILTQDAGYVRDNILTVSLPLPQDQYRTSAERVSLIDRLVQEAQTLPGVQHAALINQLPLQPGARRAPVLIPPFTDPQSPEEWDGIAGFRVITPDYFATLGIPLLRGRGIEASDREGAPPVTVVNASLAERLWPGQDPIGKQIRALYDFRGELMTVVGVVGDARDWRSERQYEMYVSVRQRPEHAYAPYLVLRTAGDESGVARALLARIRATDPGIPAVATPLDRVFGDTIVDRRFTTDLALTFAGLVLLLTLVGIYGVVSYAVARRTREVGIRIALGAEPGRVVQLLQRRTLLPVAAGVVVGLVGAALLSGSLRALLYHVAPHDPATFVAGALLIIAAAWLSSYLPASRAGRVDPSVTMRTE
jgi:predicted permease